MVISIHKRVQKPILRITGQYLRPVSTSAVDTSNGILIGRPYAGLPFMGHKKLGDRIAIKNYNESKMLDLPTSCSNGPILIMKCI